MSAYKAPCYSSTNKTMSPYLPLISTISEIVRQPRDVFQAAIRRLNNGRSDCVAVIGNHRTVRVSPNHWRKYRSANQFRQHYVGGSGMDVQWLCPDGGAAPPAALWIPLSYFPPLPVNGQSSLITSGGGT